MGHGSTVVALDLSSATNFEQVILPWPPGVSVVYDIRSQDRTKRQMVADGTIYIEHNTNLRHVEVDNVFFVGDRRGKDGISHGLFVGMINGTLPGGGGGSGGGGSVGGGSGGAAGSGGAGVESKPLEDTASESFRALSERRYWRRRGQ